MEDVHVKLARFIVDMTVTIGLTFGYLALELANTAGFDTHEGPDADDPTSYAIQYAFDRNENH